MGRSRVRERGDDQTTCRELRISAANRGEPTRSRRSSPHQLAPPRCPNPLLRGHQQLCQAAVHLSPRGLIPSATFLTCDNPARCAKAGRFDPDSTRHALAAALTSLELRECKFCRCTTQERARKRCVHQRKSHFRTISASLRSDVVAKSISGCLRSEPPSGGAPQPLPVMSKAPDKALTSSFTETLPPGRSRLARPPQPSGP